MLGINSNKYLSRASVPSEFYMKWNSKPSSYLVGYKLSLVNTTKSFSILIGEDSFSLKETSVKSSPNAIEKNES